MCLDTSICVNFTYTEFSGALTPTLYPHNRNPKQVLTDDSKFVLTFI